MRSTEERPLAAPAAGGPAIDPRIRARRIEVARHAGRRRLRRLVDLGLLLAVAAGFAGALRSPLLDVDEIRVSAGPHTPAEAILERAGVAAGDQLMDLDLGAVGRRVAELPWVGEVRVRRSLGGAVELRVTEREPAAVVGTGAAAVVVDAEGRALARVADAPDLATGLVQVRGVPGARGLVPGEFLGSASQDALELASRLAGAVPGAIGEVVVGEELRATLVQGGQVRFGERDRLEAKLRSLTTVLEQVDLTCLGELDLRAPASPVLTRREGCS